MLSLGACSAVIFLYKITFKVSFEREFNYADGVFFTFSIKNLFQYLQQKQARLSLKFYGGFLKVIFKIRKSATSTTFHNLSNETCFKKIRRKL